jgi:CMP-N-acetylneuraminic acid synthetase
MGACMLTVFLPCRKGSQRIPDKNIKSFAGVPNGLLQIKLEQLLNCTLVDQVILSSNDDRVLEYAASITDTKLVLDQRPDWLGSSETTTDQLINYVPSLINDGHVLWTHVTSPFIDENEYDKIIRLFYEKLTQGYDSLMTAKKIQTFIWNEFEAVNYDRNIEKWPRTQTIKPLYEIDSGAFIAPIEAYLSYSDRIGIKPFIYPLDGCKSLDIDWPDDFILAEQVFKKLHNI